MSTKLCPFCMRMTEGDTCHHCGKNTDYSGQPMHLPAGYVVSGAHPYVLGAALGQGGFGITYIALNMDTGERVAIKEYYPTYCSARTENSNVTAYSNQEEVYQKGKERFLDEARTLKSLSDLKSIVNVLDFFEANNSAYLVMEYLDGSSLKEYASKNGKFPAQKFLNQIRPLMEDIQKMHDRGVIHRDIAPDNIILLPDGQMKLIDFGAARSYLGDKSMTVVIKKGFAPVEQYFSTGSTASSDVYALAATIYYCITGVVPMDSALRQSERKSLAAPASLGADLSPKQEKALLKALEIQQKDRTQSAQEFWNALTPSIRIAPTPDPPPKHRIILAAVAAVLVLCLGAFLFLGKPAVSDHNPQYICAANPSYSKDAWKSNVLRSNPELTENQKVVGQIFGTSIPGIKVKTVTFLDTVYNAPETNWDVSEAGDRSVLAWVEENDSFYDLYIGAAGGINGIAATNGLFAGFMNLEEVHFNGVYHTEQADSFASMFYRCINIISVDISSLDTSNVKSMANLFYDCLNLTDLNLGKMHTENVTDMSGMFYRCESLSSLNFNDFDTSNVQDMSIMFADCTNLVELNAKGMNTENVIDMSGMFRGCAALHSLDLSGFNTKKVQNMTQMFQYCTELVYLNLSNFDTSNVSEMQIMFNGCHNLANVDIGNFDTSKVNYSIYSYRDFMEDGKRINGRPWEELFE